MEHVHTGPRTGTAAQQSRAKQDLLRHAPLPCAGAKGKRGRAFETLTTVLCGGFEK